MTKHMSGTGGEGRSKAWFWPALLGIVAAGAAMFYFAAQANGPRTPVVNPAVAEREKARYDQAMALLDQGLKLLEADKFSEALPLAEQAMALRGDLVVTHMAVAQIALQMREYSRAEQEFQVVLQKRPDDAEALLSLAVIAAARKDYGGARQKIASAVSGADLSGMVQSIPLMVLQAAANMDQPETAGQHARTALQQDDGSMAMVEAKVYGPDVIALLAEQFEQMDKLTEAGVAYAEAAKGTQGNLLKAQRAARSAEMFLAAGRREAATAQVRSAIEADPGNPQWVVLRERVEAAASQPEASSEPSMNVTPFGLPAN
jgi:tetratricopeptide (TPR) repeat protein